MKHAVLPLALLLAACQPSEAPAEPQPAAAVEPAAAPSSAGFGYDVQLAFTPATLERLKALGEKVSVSAYYFGEPVPAALHKTNDIDQIHLGDELTDVEPADQTVHMTGQVIDPAKFADIEGGKPFVLINVYTARKADGNNLINCGIFQDLIEKAQAAPMKIDCDLITPQPAPTPPDPR